MNRTFLHAVAVLIIVTAILIFSACSHEGGDAASQTVEETGNTWGQAQEFSAPELLTTGNQSPDSSVAMMLENAMNVYSLFITTIPTIDDNDFVTSSDEAIYFRVTDEKLNTMEKMRQYLSDWFSEEIIDSLISIERYIEHEGGLYVVDVAVGADATIKSEKFTLVDSSDDEQSYTATVGRDTDLDGEVDMTEDHTFVREKIDGKWVFTSFPYYR